MTRELLLDLGRFEELLDVHGAKLDRWPEPLQAEARALLASSPSAQHALSRAERLATLLDAAPDVLPSAELSARIAALPVRRPQGWVAWWPFANPFAPLFAWGAAAAFGLLIGSGVLPGLDPSSEMGSGSSVSSELADSSASDSAGSDSAGSDSASNDAAGDDEAQPDDWIELELALGLGPDWDDEP